MDFGVDAAAVDGGRGFAVGQEAVPADGRVESVEFDGCRRAVLETEDTRQRVVGRGITACLAYGLDGLDARCAVDDVGFARSDLQPADQTGCERIAVGTVVARRLDLAAGVDAVDDVDDADRVVAFGVSADTAHAVLSAAVAVGDAAVDGGFAFRYDVAHDTAHLMQ